MIGKLSGRLDHRGTDHVMIDVAGVGYIVFCSDRTLAALPGPGEAVALYTDLLVREDLMQLFGFVTPVEKEWHRLLMSVQGVGAKVSLAILGALGPDGVSRAVATGDTAAIRAAKGVGLKTAQRIVLDLKDKAPGLMAMGGTPVSATGSAPSAPAPASSAAQAGALSALGNLGYGPGEAAAAVAEAAAAEPEAGEASLIRAALKRLAPQA